jgi:hypothetical protein
METMMDTTLFDPARLPRRDADGYLWHPDLDQFMRGRDGGPAQQEESDWMDMDALAMEVAEVYDTFVDECPDEVDAESERPDVDGLLLVAVAAHPDGGSNLLWVLL